jgi:uncharacterized small protein (DUF1192 family)
MRRFVVIFHMRNSRKVYRYSGSKETVDTKTGEVERAVLVKQKVLDLNFVKIFLPERGYRMYPKEMNQSARDLLDYLKVVMDKQNVAIAPVAEIQERVDLSTASIARAKAQLIELDYIRQRAHNVYMVNPGHACKTAGDDRQTTYEAYSLLPCKKTK